MWIKFFMEYIKSPRTVGAVAPSSEILAEKMIEGIDFNKAECIIEYGPGTGIFSDKLIKRKKQETILILMEYNKEFCDQLKDKYRCIDNLYIINDSAENIDKYLENLEIKKVDYIVSGLPFASLPKSISNKILNVTKKVLKKEGLFITFQYTLFKKKYISEFFRRINYKRVLLNIPPAYVFTCHNNSISNN